MKRIFGRSAFRPSLITAAGRRLCTRLLFAVVLCAAAAAAAPGTLSAQDRFLALDVSAQAAVADREGTARALTDWAEQAGGFFVLRSADRVALRVPPESLSGLRDLLETLSLDLVAYHPRAQDIRQELAAIDAGITSRSEALERVLSFLGGADVSATLAFERELTGLMGELESLEGRRRLLLDRVRFARAEILLTSRERDFPETLPSSFPWISRMGLYRFLEETQP